MQLNEQSDKVLVCFDLDETLISSVIKESSWFNREDYKEINRAALGKPIKVEGQNFYYYSYPVPWFLKVRSEIKKMGYDVALMTLAFKSIAWQTVKNDPFFFQEDELICCEHLTGNKPHKDFSFHKQGRILTKDTVEYKWNIQKYNKVIMFDNATTEFNALKMALLEKMTDKLIYVQTEDFDIDKLCCECHNLARETAEDYEEAINRRLQEIHSHNLNLINSEIYK